MSGDACGKRYVPVRPGDPSRTVPCPKCHGRGMSEHALHFDPDCEECVYLARPTVIRLDDGLRAAAEGVCVLWFDRLEPPDSQMFRAVMLDLRAALERKP